MKRITLFILPILMVSHIFAIAGFGMQFGQNAFSVEESSASLSVPYTSLKNGAFKNSYNVGGYVYIDAIPVVDLELDFNFQGQKYEINFENPIGQMEPINFGWGSTDLYFTARKKIIGLGIPFLAKAKLFAGVGYNTHITTPRANEDMLLGLCDNDIANCDPTNLGSTLEDYMTDKDNYISSSGYHLQGGLQFKVLMLDTFLFYRHVMVKDVVPDANGYGSLNLRLGFGI
mgnify:CR=1 FL=1